MSLLTYIHRCRAIYTPVQRQTQNSANYGLEQSQMFWTQPTPGKVCTKAHPLVTQHKANAHRVHELQAPAKPPFLKASISASIRTASTSQGQSCRRSKVMRREAIDATVLPLQTTLGAE